MLDVATLLTDYGIRYWTEGNNVSPGWVNIQCPVCDDHSNHGGINPWGAYYHCWKCGGHNLSYILGIALRLPRRAAEELIEQYEGISHIQSTKALNRPSRLSLPGKPLKSIHKEYLRSRGFNPDKLEKKYGLLGTTYKGEYKYRIIIPIYQAGKAVSFQGRDYTNKHSRKYLSCSPKVSPVHYKDTLYGLDDVKGETVAVVEGVMDQWRMGDGFVCSFGTSMKPSQIRLLSQFKKVYFCFDPEPQAQERARKAGVKLASFGTVSEIIDLELGKRDPAELSPLEAKRVREELDI